ncbi:hypothetical protein BBK82_42860 [Lentzea guizhouensis]|uniref:Uncharacterized protein n=1 Tax=Lentzea guizhouensis TaxID=1586287 RepID=A0A1B2HVI8_9PSEU|nr:hypothetical protein [Lentzea guizhouensis]ANZ41695.1 hypothetical protein BBK82_42860 [Lentzea guizhouensis]
MTGAPDAPLSAIDDTVVVEYGQFCLQDLARLHGAAEAPVPAGDWLLVGGRGGVLFRSAESDHYPAVRVELWADRPPMHDEPFDATGDSTFSMDGTELQLWSITAATGCHTLRVPAANTYHVRAHVSGRADIEAVEANDPASFAEGVERWLIQIWPAWHGSAVVPQ